MPITATLEKTRKELERTLSDLDKTPLYAVVGAGDLAVAKLRDARGELNARAVRLDATVTARVESVQEDFRTAPENMKALPTRAQELLGEAIATATATYDELAGRGKSLMTRVRDQQATVDLQDQAKSTTARAKATTTTVRKQAGTAKESASTTTSTAKKSATRAKSPAKATATSARKTASAAKKATTAAADKVGG